MTKQNSNLDGNRRDFIAKCGRFAVVTPPALTLLLSTSMNSSAVAASVKGNKGDDDDRPRNNPKFDD